MPLFEYEAKTKQGIPIKGAMDALSADAVSLALREKGYYPTRIRQKGGVLSTNIEMFQKIKMKDIAVFCRQFSVIINAGIPMLRGLEIVKEQTENKKLQRILNEIFEDVQKGKALSASMKKHKEFPDMLCNMIVVGETSGTLDIILDRMAVFYEKEAALNQKIKGALTYPIAISVVAIAVVVLLVTKILPIFTSMLTGSGGELPLPTKILMGASDFLNTKWYIVIIVITLVTILIQTYVKSTEGRHNVDKMKLQIPLFGKLYKKIMTARFARTFGTLMSSGIPLLNSMEVCADVLGNVIIKEMLESTKEEIKKGLGLGETLETRGLFPPMLTQMIRVGEEAGTLDEMLQSTASFYDNEVETVTEQMTNLIQPIIIVILAIIVGFIIISIMLPMMSMYETIG